MKNPFSLEAFSDWLEKQPKSRKYDWDDFSNCACAQYAHSLGFSEHSCWYLYGHIDSPFWNMADSLAMDGQRTFGALHKRVAKAIKRELLRQVVTTDAT